MPSLNLGRGHSDEFTVSEFALAAYLGDFPRMESLLERNPESRKDQVALYLALRAKRKDVFKFLLDIGVEVPESLYGYILWEDESFLPLVHPNAEELKRAHARLPSFKLSASLQTGDITAREVQDLVFNGADARNSVFASAADEQLLPVHLAALHPDLNVMRELIRAGVDPAVVRENGKNAVRMVYENGKITADQRKKFQRLFESYDFKCVPELTLSDKIFLFFGKKIRTSSPVKSSSGDRSS